MQLASSSVGIQSPSPRPQNIFLFDTVVGKVFRLLSLARGGVLF